MTALIISNVLLWICLIAVLIALIFFSNQVSEFLIRFRAAGPNGGAITKAIRVGHQAPLFSYPDQHGTVVHLGDFKDRYTIMLFTQVTCNICQAIIPQLERLYDIQPNLRIIVTTVPVEDAQQENVPESVSLISEVELYYQYDVKLSPHLIVLDKQGKILVAERVPNFELVKTKVQIATLSA